MPPAPTSNDPQFDFMLKNSQPAKRSRVLPKVPKPVKIILGVVLGLLLLIVISSILSGRKAGATQPMLNTVARGQEILRVTQAEQSQLQDPTTQAVAATVNTTLTSDQQQLIQYLANNHTKVSPAQLAVDIDKSTDAQMQTASQNNSLDQAYITYLQQNLTKYQADLQLAYKSAGPKGKAILRTAFLSAGTLLANAPLKS